MEPNANGVVSYLVDLDLVVCWGSNFVARKFPKEESDHFQLFGLLGDSPYFESRNNFRNNLWSRALASSRKLFLKVEHQQTGRRGEDLTCGCSPGPGWGRCSDPPGGSGWRRWSCPVPAVPDPVSWHWSSSSSSSSWAPLTPRPSQSPPPVSDSDVATNTESRAEPAKEITFLQNNLNNGKIGQIWQLVENVFAIIFVYLKEFDLFAIWTAEIFGVCKQISFWIDSQ